MVDLLFYKMALVDMYCQFLCSWYHSPSFVLCTYQDRYLVIPLIMGVFVFTDIIQYIKYGIYGNDIILFTYNVIARIVTVDQDGRASPGSPGLLCPGRATLAEDIVPPSQIINKCANPCVICGICSVCILTILCFSIPV